MVPRSTAFQVAVGTFDIAGGTFHVGTTFQGDGCIFAGWEQVSGNTNMLTVNNYQPGEGAG